jgi:hypothetical protein
MTPLTKQTLNTGHFLQPTANATGHRVILFLLFQIRAERRRYRNQPFTMKV